MKKTDKLKEKETSKTFSTICPNCGHCIRHFGKVELYYCGGCKNSVDVFSPHNKTKELKRKYRQELPF